MLHIKLRLAAKSIIVLNLSIGDVIVFVKRAVIPSQRTRYTDPMLVQCWARVANDGPTLNQHFVSVSWQSWIVTHLHSNVILHCQYCRVRELFYRNVGARLDQKKIMLTENSADIVLFTLVTLTNLIST